MKPRSTSRLAYPLVTAIAALLAASQAHAQLTWDANGTGAAQTDGAGVWLTANQWWNGSANTNWVSGSAADFGNGGAGGAVTLASATTVASLTFNSFTGTYTLGTTTSTITLNGGITKNTGAGAATIISPITLGAAQSWNNNSLGFLTIGTGAVTNAGFLLTLGGTGNITVSSVISGAGGLTKSDAGLATLSGANTYDGVTTINGGVLAVSTLANGLSASAIGDSSNAAANLVFGAPAATLRHTGAAASTNRGFTLSSGAGGGATIESSGTGALSFTDNTVAINYGTAGETRALTLGGTNINENVFGKVLAQNGIGATSLVKAGAGTWVLNAANTYAGGSTVNTGSLVFRTLASKSGTGTHAFGAGTTLGLGVGVGNFTTSDVDDAFSGAMNLTNLSNVTVTSTTSVGIDTNAASLIYNTNIGSVTKGLTKFGVNTLTLGGSSSYTGVTTVNSGTLSIGTVANANSSSPIGAFATTSATGLVLNGATLMYTGATASTTRGFTVNGNSTINVATAGAKLTMGDFTMASAPNFTVSGGAGSSLDLGTFTFSTPTNQTIAANIPVSIASIVSTVAQEIRNSGSALLTVGNYSATAGTFVGGNVLITGTVSIVAAFTNSQASGTITYTGNSFTTSQLSIWGANTFAVGGSGTIGTSGTFANPVSFRDNGTFKYDSSANQTLSGNLGMNTGTISHLNMSGSGTLKLTGTNTANNTTAATGVTTVSNGILQYGKQVSLYNNNTASWTAAKINVKNGGTLAFNVGGTGEFTTGDVTTLLGALAASSGATNGMNAGSRFGFDTTTAAGGTFTIANVIADSTGLSGGARGLTKLGTGSLVLTNTNTYTGATTVSADTLTLGVSGTIANSNKIIVGDAGSSGAVLDVSAKTSGFTIGSSQKLSGIGTVDANDGSTKYTVAIDGIHAPGNSVGKQTIDGNLNYSTSASIFEWELGATLKDTSTGTRGTDYDAVNVSGTLAGTDAIFRVVLADTTNFADTFWTSDHTWTDIFKTSDGGTNVSFAAAFLASGFQYYNSTGAITNTNATRSFTITGNTLSWSAVPEPTSALVGLLIGAGLLRRRRSA